MMAAPSFDADIKPLFRAQDVNAMRNFGGFDLHRYEDVRTNAEKILARLRDGSMPCDGPWPDENIDKFDSWIKGGMMA